MPATISAVVQLLRPRQFLKSGFAVMPLIFSGQFRYVDAVATTALAVLAFIACSSAVYCLNDILDADSDRQHPVKKHRPIARGAVSIHLAGTVGGLSGVIGLSLGAWLGWPTLLVLAAYLALQVLYCFAWKHAPLLDVMSIAAGFLLRVIGGATAISVVPSPWLLICTTFLALLLAVVKRRQEVVLSATGTTTRRVLAHYPLALLDQLIAGLVPTTLLSYMLYAYHVQPPGFLATSAFVAYGLFRYLYLVHTRAIGEQPEDVLLRDPATLVNVTLWAVVSAVCLMWLPPKT